MPKGNRNVDIRLRLSESDRDLITEKMAAAGIRNREAYIRKMILDGYVVRLDLADVRKMVQMFSSATNNLNQIAKRAMRHVASMKAIFETCASITISFGCRRRRYCGSWQRFSV